MALHRYVCFLAVATFFLLIAGGLVTSQDYGLAVPDWPKSFGTWMPEMTGGVLFEHGHRMIAGTVGILTLFLAGWMWFAEKRKWVRNLALIALGAVVVQAVLGGLTVLYKLPTAVSTLHATLAQTFFSLIVALAVFTSRRWKQEFQRFGRDGSPGKLFRIAVATTLAIYLQLILGSWMRHSDAALAIPDFPLVFGGLVPPYFTLEIAVHYAHRLNAVLVFALICAATLTVTRSHNLAPPLMYPAVALSILIFLQIALGALAVWTRTAVIFATAHMAVGALILVSSVVLTIHAYLYSRNTENNALLVAAFGAGKNA